MIAVNTLKEYLLLKIYQDSPPNSALRTYPQTLTASAIFYAEYTNRYQEPQVSDTDCLTPPISKLDLTHPNFFSLLRQKGTFIITTRFAIT